MIIFFLPHRNEARGLGGIFFDYLNSDDWNSDMNFVSNVGKTFINTYKTIVQETIKSPSWNDKDKLLQFHRRSRYVEFNLLYDRGTKFWFRDRWKHRGYLYVSSTYELHGKNFW